MKNEFLAPRKSLGQNFLQDANIIRKIVASLNIKVGDVVLEVGPGRGALTELILAHAGVLHVVEFDRDLAEYWRSRSSATTVEESSSLVVHESDILNFDLSEIISRSEQKIKVIGNLPYNISSPILFHLLQYAHAIDSQVLMLQKEVVERMSAQPGGKQFGRLSVMLQYRYHIENLFTVPATAFFPPPKVESAIARLTPRESIVLPARNLDDFALIVKQSFSQRRKTLRNNMKNYLTVEQIESLGILPSARAETLSVEEFVKLANLYTQTNNAHS